MYIYRFMCIYTYRPSPAQGPGPISGLHASEGSAEMTLLLQAWPSLDQMEKVMGSSRCSLEMAKKRDVA